MRVLLLLAVVTSVVLGAYKPVSVFVLTRHGARAPYLSIPGIHLETWNCSFSLFEYPGIAPVSSSIDFDGQLFRKAYMPNREALPGNCSQGQLTNIGALQLRSTGAWLRSKLGDFLPASWDANVMYARATDIDRTFESAQNLLQTLFVPASPKASSTQSSVVNIWTIEKGFDDLDVAQNAPCPVLKETCHAITLTPQWQQHLASVEPLVGVIAKAFNVTLDEVPDLSSVLEVLRARQAQGLPIPIDMKTYLQVQEAASWELRTLYNNNTVHELTSGQLVRSILDIFQGVVNGTSDRLFTLFAAHDTTVAPLLSALQIPWTTWPQYAANIYIGLNVDEHGNYFVELLHDRKPVQAAGCGPMCPWSQFVGIAQKSVIHNRDGLCNAGSKRRKRSALLVDPVVTYLC